METSIGKVEEWRKSFEKERVEISGSEDASCMRSYDGIVDIRKFCKDERIIEWENK